MSAEYVRRYYGVPAKRGGRIRFLYNGEREGTITSFDGQYLRVRFDGETRSERLHPTWKVDYLDNDGKCIWKSKDS